MSFEVQIVGLAPLLEALNRFPEAVRPALQQAAEVALLSLIPDLADYPPPPAGSTYRRTGTLGRLWTAAQPEFAADASGFEASIGNATPYGDFVQGEHQASMHRGRWKTVEDVVNSHQAEIEAYF